MRKLIRAVAIIYGVYLILTLLIITPALNFLPARYVEDNYGRTLTSKWIVLNPFKLSLDIGELALSEPNGEDFVSIKDSSINLSMESLWQSGVVLDELRIHDLWLHLVHLGDGEFNFSDLIPESEPEPEPEQPAEPLGVTVRLLDLESNTIAVEDRARDEPYASQWDDFGFVAENVSTVHVEGQPYTFTVTGPEGGKLDWRGELSVAGGFSRGTIGITDLSLVNVGKVAEPWLAFAVNDGRLNLQGDYNVSWADDLSYDVDKASASLNNLEILPKSPQELADTGLSLRSLEVTGIQVASADLHAGIESIKLDGLGVDGWMEEDRISLQEMLLGPPSEEATPTEQPAEADADESWSAAIGRVALTDSSINFRTDYTDPPLLPITPIEASVENLNWPFEGDSPLSLSLRINDQTSFSADGNLALADGNGEIHYDLDGLRLPWFNPNLPRALKATIRDGLVVIEGDVSLQDFAPTLIQLDGAINELAVRVEDVETLSDEEETILSGWRSVRAESMVVNMNEQTLDIKRVAIDDYSGRIHIYEDGSINTSRVLQEELEGDEPEGTASDDTEQQEEGSQEKESTDSEAAWAFNLPEIVITDSEVDFMDQSLPLPFRTVIGDLNGSIKGLASTAEAPAEVDIKGSVDGYSPVTLSGTAAPFDTPIGLDLALVFQSLDMAMLSPYTATYAGYKIDRGLLDLDLTYALHDGELKGNNKIRMEKLQLGDKIDSEQAPDLPLDLAVAIMSDSKGVIDIAVPVSGNVNDPSFELGSVIASALAGLITEAVTAPFKLLANLVGSEDDLQNINFPAGSAELDEAGGKKIQELSQALAERPSITIVVTGVISPESDRERLQKDALTAELVAAGLSQEDVDSKNEQWEKAINRRYATLGGSPEEAESLTVRDKYLQIAQGITISDKQLEDLANQRSFAAKTAFIDSGGLDPDRVVIARADLSTEANRISGVTMEVE